MTINDPHILRFGLFENLYGDDAIATLPRRAPERGPRVLAEEHRDHDVRQRLRHGEHRVRETRLPTRGAPESHVAPPPGRLAHRGSWLTAPPAAASPSRRDEI